MNRAQIHNLTLDECLEYIDTDDPMVFRLLVLMEEAIVEAKETAAAAAAEAAEEAAEDVEWERKRISEWLLDVVETHEGEALVNALRMYANNLADN